MNKECVKKVPSLPQKKKTPVGILRHLYKSDEFLTVQIHRDLGWLDFNLRVLMLAADASIPLFERLNYLAIFSSNLDEFFMKRVVPLRSESVGQHAVNIGATGYRPDIFNQVRKKVIELCELQDQIFNQKITHDLQKIGVFILQSQHLTTKEKQRCEELFMERVFPVLTPLAVDAGHPFPFISNNSQSLGVILQSPGCTEKIFARVKIPTVLPSYLNVSTQANEFRMINITTLITLHIDRLFEGMKIVKVMPFRILRNANVEFDEHEADDLLDLIEEGVRLRRFEQVIKLQYTGRPVPWLIDLLQEQLELADDDIYQTAGLLDFTALKSITDLPVAPELRFPPWHPRPCKDLENIDEDWSIFAEIRAKDILVHHPYESFESSVQRFVTEAALDPKVVAIKMTLYRIAKNSPFIPAIIKAVENGKQVVVIIEIRARFDEQRNIELVRQLEDVGVHVVYGIAGVKTHAKVTLVIRNEEDGFRSYCHIGTGNYHMHTAKLYTDLSLFTCRREITEEIVPFFHYLTGKSKRCSYEQLFIAPINMKQKFLALIENEIDNKLRKKPAQIIAKMNAFEDKDIARALVKASQQGVSITLLVRGFCCLRAGVPRITDNVRVLSHLGRFLEHSRLFYFAGGSDNPLEGKFFLGSADWMHRNLDYRVELVVPVSSAEHKERLYDILQIMINDKQQAWQMLPNGTYAHASSGLRTRKGARKGARKGTHDILMYHELEGDALRQQEL